MGVVRISCAPVPGSYDHKRHHAARHAGRPYEEDAPAPVWDFFLTRSDGTSVRFHTNYSNNKVEVANLSDPPPLPGPPEAGRGKSDGRGTYRRKTACNYTSWANHGGGGGADAAQENVGGTGGADAAQENVGGTGGAGAVPNPQASNGGGGGNAAQASNGGGGGGNAAQANHGGGGGGDGSNWQGWQWDSWNEWRGWQSNPRWH